MPPPWDFRESKEVHSFVSELKNKHDDIEFIIHRAQIILLKIYQTEVRSLKAQLVNAKRATLIRNTCIIGQAFSSRRISMWKGEAKWLICFQKRDHIPVIRTHLRGHTWGGYDRTRRLEGRLISRNQSRINCNIYGKLKLYSTKTECERFFSHETSFLIILIINCAFCWMIFSTRSSLTQWITRTSEANK